MPVACGAWQPCQAIYPCHAQRKQHSGLSIRLRREVGGEGEHRLRVYSELIFGHQVNKPAKGSNNYNRTCMPYPFRGKMSAEEASSGFRIAIDGFQKTAYYKPGAPDTGAQTCLNCTALCFNPQP